MEGIYKYVKVNGQYRLTDLNTGRQHRELVNTGEVPESAGAVTISGDIVIMCGDYSPSLNIGALPDDLENIRTAIETGDYTIF